MLHYDPQHVSSSTLLILRRTNCITTASGIVTLCKQPYSTIEGVLFRTLEGVRDFPFFRSSLPALRPTQPPVHNIPRALSPEIRRTGSDDHSPPSFEIMNPLSHTTPPYAFMPNNETTLSVHLLTNV